MRTKIFIKSDFTEFISEFLKENSKKNLISKNDEKFLYEKHIYDSLSIKLFFEKYKIKNANILDIGCGGGFPCVPIAIEYPDFQVVGVDSIAKKIVSVEEIKQHLGLKNLDLICNRIENIKDRTFDVVVSRAVSNLRKILEYGIPKLKKGGYFVAYKSKKALEEIEIAGEFLKKNQFEVIDVIQYKLPLDEAYERNLVVIRHV